MVVLGIVRGIVLWIGRVNVTFNMVDVVIGGGKAIMSVLLEMDKEMFLCVPLLVFLFLLEDKIN